MKWPFNNKRYCLLGEDFALFSWRATYDARRRDALIIRGCTITYQLARSGLYSILNQGFESHQERDAHVVFWWMIIHSRTVEVPVSMSRTWLFVNFQKQHFQLLTGHINIPENNTSKTSSKRTDKILKDLNRNKNSKRYLVGEIFRNK